MGWCISWSLSIDNIMSRAVLAVLPESACPMRGATFAMNIVIASCLFTHLSWKRFSFYASQFKMAYNQTQSYKLWLQKLSSSADDAVSNFRHTIILLLILNILHQLSYSKCNCLKRSLLSFTWNEFFFQTCLLGWKFSLSYFQKLSSHVFR